MVGEGLDKAIVRWCRARLTGDVVGYSLIGVYFLLMAWLGIPIRQWVLAVVGGTVLALLVVPVFAFMTIPATWDSGSVSALGGLAVFAALVSGVLNEIEIQRFKEAPEREVPP